ncbi:Hypothetical predicted protein [Cloeon dipterum]|uniref:Piwi domain-containing protein n=2 Tax=Cloeon dipterum TaxID=197152 RepID=A0A8S1DUB1_9INSE|nr:Hypothetical predicted protein [Cloeon dipterum]
MDTPRPRGRARGRIPSQSVSRSRSPIRPGPSAPKVETPSTSRQGFGGTSQPGPSKLLIPVKKFEGNKKGSAGTPIELQSNFFYLSSVPQFTVYQFSVQFEPEEERTHVRKALFAECKSELGVANLFSGAILFTSKKLPRNPLVMEAKGKEGTTFKITVNYVKQLHFGDHEYNLVLNIIWKKLLRMLNLKMIGRKFFDANAKINIPEFNMQLWPGYNTTVRQHEDGLLLSVSLIHKVMRTQTALDVIKDMYRLHRDQFQVKVKEALLGTVVVTMFNDRTYHIDDITFEETPKSSFPFNGNNITFIDYYKLKYQIIIKNHDQPLLVSKNKARLIRTGQGDQPIFLVPELCCMTGYTDEMRKNFQLMNRVANHTRSSPNEKINQLFKFAERLLEKPEIVKEMNEWNMKITPKLLRFHGRVLPSENIIQGQNGSLKYPVGSNADWTNQVKAKAALSSGTFDSWLAIYPQFMKREVCSFLNDLIRVGSGMGLRIGHPRTKELQSDNLSEYINEIQSLLSHMTLDIIVCFVGDVRVDRYNAIKKYCCANRSVMSQIVTRRSITRGNNLSIATKIVLQINCKVGGAPWTVANPTLLQGIMVIGFDVSKDSLNRNIAFGALVATMNDSFSSYHSQPIEIIKGHDLSSKICSALQKTLEAYEKKNGTLPTKVVFYRDGEDEFQDVCIAEKLKVNFLSPISIYYVSPNFRFKIVCYLISRI